MNASCYQPLRAVEVQTKPNRTPRRMLCPSESSWINRGPLFYYGPDGCEIGHHLGFSTCWNPINHGIFWDTPPINWCRITPGLLARAGFSSWHQQALKRSAAGPIEMDSKAAKWWGFSWSFICFRVPIKNRTSWKKLLSFRVWGTPNKLSDSQSLG